MYGDEYNGQWHMGRRHGEGDYFSGGMPALDLCKYMHPLVGKAKRQGVPLRAGVDSLPGKVVDGTLTNFINTKPSGVVEKFSRGMPSIFIHRVIWSADGLHYVGEWKAGQMHGRGTCVFRNGDMYVGTFKANLMEGNGSMMTVSGCQYDGEWHKGKMEGRCVAPRWA